MNPVLTRFPRLVSAAAVLALLSACGMMTPASNPAPQAPPPPDATPEERLVAAIEQAGCVLTAENRDSVLLRANVTAEQTAAIITALNAQGQAEAADAGSIRILSDLCI
jgi:hypothetical protein